MVSSGELTLCVDARVLSEYDEVLRRLKFRFDAAAIGLLLGYIEYRGHMVASSPLTCPLPDPDDAVFLQIALSDEAECLVTGNKAHFPVGLWQGATVLTPSEFLAFYRERQRATGGT